MTGPFERRGGRAAQPPVAELPGEDADPNTPCLEHLGKLASTLAAIQEQFVDEDVRGSWEDWRPSRPEPGDQPQLFPVGRIRGMGGPQAELAVPLLDFSHWKLPAEERSVDFVRGLMARTIGSRNPGEIQVQVYDPDGLGSKLAPFAPLAEAGLLQNVAPKDIGKMLDELAAEIIRIKEQVLAGKYESVREMAEATGKRPEPWRIAILMGNNIELKTEQQQQLARILKNGGACGIHVIMQGVAGFDKKNYEDLEEVKHQRGKGLTTTLTDRLPITINPGPPEAMVTDMCRDIVAEFTAGTPPPEFKDLLALGGEIWSKLTVEKMGALVGVDPTTGKPVAFELGDNPPHALLVGPSGSGKTNLLYAFMVDMARKYSPDELEINMLDFKEGVSAAKFGPSRKDNTWLPHINILGTGVNEDIEFGVAFLRYLEAELERRAEAFKEYEVDKLADLRQEDPGGKWPRIVAILDEFQELFTNPNSALVGEAGRLLEKVARLGRSMGVHLVLASQDTAGIQELWKRPGIVKQLVARVALPQAPTNVLHQQNTAATTLPKHHAIVNNASGAPGQNQVARVPLVSDEDIRDVKKQTFEKAERPRRPRIFDGNHVPTLEDYLPELAKVTGRRPAEALLGQNIDAVDSNTARVKLNRAPGRNLAIIGTVEKEVMQVVGSTTLSIAAQHEPGDARYSIVCLDDELFDHADALKAKLGDDAQVYDLDQVRDFVSKTHEEVDKRQKGEINTPAKPHYIIMYPADAANNLLRSDKKPGVGAASQSSAEKLAQVLREGSEHRTHILGWWRGATQLKDTVSGGAIGGGRMDCIGAWIGLDIPEGDAKTLSGDPNLKWQPRSGRALFFDRSISSKTRTIVPFGGRAKRRSKRNSSEDEE